ncbi:MAG TPA: DegT/DnrJ/EryC1/StrS family aminotransferase, partial [Planctomycetota bacterium]|nr:DegT/DnrJ/EryC1/StrS family aminotransferase [Planctomycetota bacterium]
REHGGRAKYVHEMPGFTARLDAIQAAILRVKLRRLARANERRRLAAARYRARLAGVEGIRLAPEVRDGEEVHHLFVVQVDRRDAVRARLAEKGIQTGLHYPVPLHLQAAFAGCGAKPGDFPVAEAAARDGLSLPMYPELTDAQVARVCAALREAVAAAAG